MADVNFSRVSTSIALMACATSLAACGSVAETATAASACPTAAPDSGGTPDWTLPGSTGSVAVTGSTETTAPSITVEAPFSVTETQVHTLQAGDGPVVADTATASVCYMGVNGRDGSVFDSTEGGPPAEFPVNRVIAGWTEALLKMKVGDRWRLFVPANLAYGEEGYGDAIPPHSTLIFELELVGIGSQPATR